MAKEKLDTIGNDYPMVKDCIIEMIYEWHYNDKNTWLYLINALQIVQNNEIAEAITKLAKSHNGESTENQSLKEIKRDKDREKDHRDSQKDEWDKKEKIYITKNSHTVTSE